MLLANLNGKEHLRHRAVSLRQHGFLVDKGYDTLSDIGVVFRKAQHRIAGEDSC